MSLDFFVNKIPGLFDRNFATSYLLPATFFWLVTTYFFFLGYGIAFIGYRLLPSSDPQYQLVSIPNREDLPVLFGVFAFLTVFLALWLLLLNKVFILWLEGFLPPVSWFRAWAIKNYRTLQKNHNNATATYRDALSKPEKTNINDLKKQYALTLIMLRNYPKSESLILPTRFGNIIRSAEYYAFEKYGADPTALQTRLLYVVDEKFKAASDGAKAKVDFAVNSFFLVGLLITEFAVLAFFAPNRNALLSGYWYFGPVLLLLMLAAYQMAVAQALEWAEYIRSSYDLFLRPLIEKMGLALPETNEDEKEFWLSHSQSIIYGTPIRYSSNFSPINDGGNKLSKEVDRLPRMNRFLRGRGRIIRNR